MGGIDPGEFISIVGEMVGTPKSIPATSFHISSHRFRPPSKGYPATSLSEGYNHKFSDRN